MESLQDLAVYCLLLVCSSADCLAVYSTVLCIVRRRAERQSSPRPDDMACETRMMYERNKASKFGLERVELAERANKQRAALKCRVFHKERQRERKKHWLDDGADE